MVSYPIKHQLFNRIAYISCLVLSATLMLIYKDPLEGISLLGIALLFDPFNVNTRWDHRPRWQRSWLICHATIFFALFGYELWSVFFH